MNDLYNIFGTRITNALTRNGIYSIEQLKEENSKYPIEKWYGYSGHWRCIGPKAYEKIKEYLKDQDAMPFPFRKFCKLLYGIERLLR